MKTTLEISDGLFRKAKATAAQRGQTLKQFVTEALQEKLSNTVSGTKRATAPWMEYFGVFGKTAEMRAETRRIQKSIDAEFEVIEPEDKA